MKWSLQLLLLALVLLIIWLGSCTDLQSESWQPEPLPAQDRPP